MTERIEQEDLQEIWNQLSVNGRNFAKSVGVFGLSKPREQLEADSANDEEPFAVDAGIQELKQVGVLEEVTLTQERKEMLSEMGEFSDVDNKPLIQMTPEEEKYLRLRSDIARYKDDPKWNEVRYRLRASFQKVVDERI